MTASRKRLKYTGNIRNIRAKVYAHTPKDPIPFPPYSVPDYAKQPQTNYLLLYFSVGVMAPCHARQPASKHGRKGQLQHTIGLRAVCALS